MILWSIDPGTLQSALVVVEHDGSDLRVRDACTILNAALLPRLETAPLGATLVIEKFQPRGMPIGHDSVETMIWSGRFFQAWPNAGTRHWLTRQAVKLHLTGVVTSNDGNVRTCLLDRFGPGRELAIGTIKRKGPLWGVKAHEFAALACAVVWIEQHATPHLAVAPHVTPA